MKIISFEAENVKKLRVVQITPRGNVVQITGANGSGKSSVLDAIFMALAGKSAVPSEPVRQGEEKAVIRLDLGEYVVTRRFTKGKDGEEGSTSLTVSSADGKAKYGSPQKMLDDLLGTLTFDPLAFSRMDAKLQRVELARLLGITDQLATLERQRKSHFDDRTEVNRDLKSAAARRDAVTVSTEKVERVDVTAVMSEISEAQHHNEQLQRESNHRETKTTHLNQLVQRARDLRRQAAELIASAEEVEETQKVMQAEIEALPALAEPKDIAPLRQRVLDAQAINTECDRRDQRAALQKEVDELEKSSSHLTKSIEEIEVAKQALIAGAKMPVPDLGFDDEGVTYKALPFAQASGAEQLRVSVAIAMAAKPELRVLRIKDGSLLDETSLAMLEEMADTHDFQCWIERVDTSGSVGIIMEDGTAREAALAGVA